VPDTDLDLDNLDLGDPEAVKHLKAWAQRQADAAKSAQENLVAAQQAAHATEVKATLRDLGVPESLANLYPSDAPTTKDAIKTFIKDNVGIDPDVNTEWARYSQRAGQGEAPPAAEDEMEAYAKKLIEGNRKFYSRPYDLSPDEKLEIEEIQLKVVNELLPKWDNDVASGRMGPIIDPQGFGGLIDPPIYARRASFHMQATPR